MKLVLSLVVAAVLSVGTAMAAEAPTGPITLKAKQGNITFNHKSHAAQKCDACHPTVPMKIEPVAKDAAHKLCLDCHKAEAKGPTKCAECHKKA
ncbi:cytochrome c3 family protein [Anaeromyxobacter oryzisoli]|jgi:class III cytochrome C family protein|uniref:cytochrome c3 family protein n=1 Tax=Anaeromyxobacter oryzisoli TaxID=2925408 RepID=UPI001F59A0B3|nr:cytochrome c3 family protein [Anaeromyxobacter sp. SG63]